MSKQTIDPNISKQKPAMNEQPESDSSFGHPLGEDHGQSGSPLEGETSDGSRYSGTGRIPIDKDNAIEGQTRAKKHNSGSRPGQD